MYIVTVQGSCGKSFYSEDYGSLKRTMSAARAWRDIHCPGALIDYQMVLTA